MENQRKLIEEIDEGYKYFWTRSDKPWRNKIYEADILAKTFQKFGKSEDGKCISRQKEDIFESSGGLRDLSLQSDNIVRFTP